MIDYQYYNIEPGYPDSGRWIFRDDFTVRLIDRKILSLIYPAKNYLLFSPFTVVFDKGQPLAYIHTFPFIPNMISLKSFHIHISL